METAASEDKEKNGEFLEALSEYRRLADGGDHGEEEESDDTLQEADYRREGRLQQGHRGSRCWRS